MVGPPRRAARGTSGLPLRQRRRGSRLAAVRGPPRQATRRAEADGPRAAPPPPGRGAAPRSCRGLPRKAAAGTTEHLPSGRRGARREKGGQCETEDLPPSPGAPRAAGVNGSGQGAARRAPSRGPKGPKPPGRGERADTPGMRTPWGGAAGRPMKPSAFPFSDLGDGRGGRSGGQGPPPGNAPGTPGEAGRGRRRPQGPAPGTGPERPGGRPGSSGPWRPRGSG